jgi:hypothetical protein
VSEVTLRASKEAEEVYIVASLENLTRLLVEEPQTVEEANSFIRENEIAKIFKEVIQHSPDGSGSIITGQRGEKLKDWFSAEIYPSPSANDSSGSFIQVRGIFNNPDGKRPGREYILQLSDANSEESYQPLIRARSSGQTFLPGQYDRAKSSGYVDVRFVPPLLIEVADDLLSAFYGVQDRVRIREEARTGKSLGELAAEVTLGDPQ